MYLFNSICINYNWTKRSIFISFNYLSLKFYSVNKFNNISLVSTLFIVAMHKYVERKLTVDNDIYIYKNTMNRYKNQRLFERVYIGIYRFGEITAVRKRWNDYWQSHGDILKSTRWKFNKTRLETITIEWDSAFCNLFDTCAEFKSVFEFGMEGKKKKRKWRRRSIRKLETIITEPVQ